MAPEAKNITVSITCRDQVAVLRVEDDGPGFDVEAAGDDRVGGLMSMRRQAELLGGTFEMTAAPGQGTRLTVRVPARGNNL